MPQPTSPPAQIVADTIVRTVELGVRITDAAVAGETTVLWCELVVEGRGGARAAGWSGSTATASSAVSATSRWSGIPSSCGSGCRATGVSMTAATARSSPTTTAGWPARARRPPGAARRSCCGGSLIDKATVSAVARELGRSWDTVKSIAVAATGELLITAGPARLDGVRVIGVDEHKWSHVLGANADGFVTVITDLTPVLAGHGPARLLDMVPGAPRPRWPAGWPPAIRASGTGVEIVATDGFGGYKAAAVEALPDAVTSWTRFTSSPSRAEARPVPPARPAGHLGHRGRTGDPIYGVRRALRTRDGAAHRAAVGPHRRGVRRRRLRRGRDDLPRLSLCTSPRF